MLLRWSGSAPDFPEDAADFFLGCWHHTLGHRDGLVLQTICLLLKIVLLATSCGDRRHCNRFGNTSDDFVSGACLLDVNVRESQCIISLLNNLLLSADDRADSFLLVYDFWHMYVVAFALFVFDSINFYFFRIF